MANLNCPNCSKMLTVPEHYAGHLMKCPLCSDHFTVPSMEEFAGAQTAVAAQPPPQQATPSQQGTTSQQPLPGKWQAMAGGSGGHPNPGQRPSSPWYADEKHYREVLFPELSRVMGGKPSPVSGFPKPGNYPFQMPRPPASASSAAVTPRPPAPSRATLPGFDYDGTTANYGTSLDDINRQRRNLYQFDSTLASAEDVRKRFGRGRDDLEKRATAGGGDDKAVHRVLSAFDKVAQSAERLAERNERLGAVEAAKSARDATRQEARETKQAEQDQAKASAEVRSQQAEELRKLREDEQAKRAAWQRMTGKSSAGDMLFGAEKLERDPRGYLMNVAGMMMTGPIMSRMAGLFSNTVGMAGRGYQIGGLAGAAVGGAAGAMTDVMRLSRDANPQAADSEDQSWSLARTRFGTIVGADYWANVNARGIQRVSADAKAELGFVRNFQKRAAGHAGELSDHAGTMTYGPLTTPISYYRAASDAMAGRASPEPKRPDMEAAPALAGVGGAAGTASYESWAMSFGMSSLNGSSIEQQKILEQLENMNRRMERLTDNSENLKNIIPAFR